jgi:hypothetical protein
MGWDREIDEEEQKRIDEMNAACEAEMDEPEPEPDPARQGIDRIRTKDGDLHHPLQHRCFESALKYWRTLKRLGLLETEDKDLVDFISEFQTTGAKLAGALGDVARGEELCDRAFRVAYSKACVGSLAQVAGRPRSRRAEKASASKDGQRSAQATLRDPRRHSEVDG